MKKIILIVLLNSWYLFSLAQAEPQGLNAGDPAPDFVGKDQYGKEVSLKHLLKKQSVVMVFYRGQWCPYCNRELKALEDSLQFIHAKGAVVLAVTPEKPDNISKTIEKTKASYSVLYDEGMSIMKSYRVNYQVDSLTVTRYKTYGLDFNTMNGVNGANLPVPAVYIINQKGKIVYRHFDPDYRNRASIADIIKNL